MIFPEKQDGIIYRRPFSTFGYNGWPSVCIDSENIVYAVCSGGRIAHIDPFGKTFLFKSCDNGLSWGCPSLINDTPLDDRDAGIISLGGGRLVLSWFTNSPEMYTEPGFRKYITDSCKDKKAAGVLEASLDLLKTYSGRKDLCGSFIRVSEDNGRSWGETVKLPVSSPHGPVLLSDGSLFYAGTGMCSDEVADSQIAAYKSTDGGYTWNFVSFIDSIKITDTERYSEPHAVELKNGRILVAVRAECDSKNLKRTVVTTYSDDGGKTWSKEKDTGICGLPPHLMRHSSGVIICSVGRRDAPFGQRAYVSYDEGETWADEYVLRDDGPDSDLGYPCTAEFPDGSLITVYYQLYSESDNEKRSLLYTKWKLKG